MASTVLLRPIHRRSPWYTALCMGLSLSSISLIADERAYPEWNWLPESELNDSQHCMIKKSCQGAYIEPAMDWPEADQDPENSTLKASADESLMGTSKVNLKGDVVISKGPRSIKADQAKLNRDTNQLELTGNIEMREPGMLLRSDHGEINVGTGLGYFENTRMLNYQSGLRASAARFNRSSETVIDLEQAQYTQCPPNNETWTLNASALHLDQTTGMGNAKHTVVKIKDVPIFYSPYMTFPIDERRASGFLWPTIVNSGNGFEFSVPYYLNIAPNMDATFTPRFMQERGTLAELETRYLNEYSFWTVSGSDLSDDQLTEQHRWSIGVDEVGEFNDNWNHFIRYAKVSDDDFFKDLSIDSLESQNQNNISQSAGVSYTDKNWSGDVLISDYQNLSSVYDQPYQRLPQVNFSNINTAESFTPDLLLSVQYTEFDHQQAKDKGGNFDTGSRSYGEIGVSFPMHWAAGFITPTAKVRHVSYQLKGLSDTENDTPSTTAPMASIDSGLFFERILTESNYTQTLEPRLFVLYNDYEAQTDHPNFDSQALHFSYQQLFRDTRFSGHDRLDDSQHASLGLASRFIDNATGRETLSFGIGQVFYKQDRRIQENMSNQQLENLSHSELAAELQYRANDNVWLNSSSLWDSKQDKINEAGFSVHYQTAIQLWNVGYRYLRHDENSGTERELEQADFSTVLPINDRWKMMARFRYDVSEDRSLEDLVGIEYEDCCWLARVVYQRAVSDESLGGNQEIIADREHKIVIQFQLKGLGGIGTKAANLLEESILGYQP